MTRLAVDIQHVEKTYQAGKGKQAKQALKGVSLEVPEGAFFGLLGPNGAGKSTLINIMAGLVVKSSGVVRICGHDIDSQTRAARLALGVVPQELIVDTFFTVREALEIHAGYYGVTKEKRRTQEIIDALGLTQQADVPSRRLSGGMRRRLLIGKALVHQPKVLILDEPTAGVDVELRDQLWNYVTRLNKEQGTTIVLTTHYLEEAQALCDEIAILNHGQIIARDSKKKLMQQMDDKRLVCSFQQPLQAVPTQLPAWMQTSLNEEGALVIQFRPSEHATGQVLSEVQKLGLEIRDLSTCEPELEDVFRRLVA